MAQERWKRVQGEKGYLISSWGRIFSLKSERIIRPYLHKSRSNYYLRIELNRKKYLVHCLVANNFLKNQKRELEILFPNANLQVDHLDRNTLNPNLKNLMWKTESENKIHRHETDIIKFGGKVYKTAFDKTFLDHIEGSQDE